MLIYALSLGLSSLLPGSLPEKHSPFCFMPFFQSPNVLEYHIFERGRQQYFPSHRPLYNVTLSLSPASGGVSVLFS